MNRERTVPCDFFTRTIYIYRYIFAVLSKRVESTLLCAAARAGI